MWGWCRIHRWVIYPHKCERDRITVWLQTDDDHKYEFRYTQENSNK